MAKLSFLGIDCEVHQEIYSHNQQVCLQLFAEDTERNRASGIHPGEPVTTATSCLPSYSFSKGETAIKNYSENEGILDALLRAGMVELTGREAVNGFTSFPIVRLVL